MLLSATTSSADAVLPLRVRYRQEMNCQIVHDSIHRRDGWTVTYLLSVDGIAAGFGSIAVAGPWKEKPSIFEFYVVPEQRAHSFKLFEALLTASNTLFMEIQSSDLLLTAMLHTYARDIWSEKVVFRDAITTALPANGAMIQQLTPDQETWNAIAAIPPTSHHAALFKRRGSSRSRTFSSAPSALIDNRSWQRPLCSRTL